MLSPITNVPVQRRRSDSQMLWPERKTHGLQGRNHVWIPVLYRYPNLSNPSRMLSRFVTFRSPFHCNNNVHYQPPLLDDPHSLQDDSHLSMVERRPWTLKAGCRRLPKRFRDLLPEPAIAAQPLQGSSSNAHSNLLSDESTPHLISPTTDQSMGHRIRGFFKTQRDNFGLFRKYFSERPPSHDPEEHATSNDLRDVSDHTSPSALSPKDFYPYPNQSAYRLGDWYWNGGVQKSRTSFNELLDIVGDPEFSPADVRNTKWDRVNRVLADEEWTDDDAGWQCTPVSISVPFQARRNATTNVDGSPEECVVGELYHRNLVSVIRETLSNASRDDHFHYEPYALQWQPENASEPVNVYGELCTSKAFIEAHNALQDSPPEPRCNLPRHIVALMFASDSTKLTSFGDAKLWPLYLFFGNESKYRRCKPSCRLSNHVAYFQSVSRSQLPRSN